MNIKEIKNKNIKEKLMFKELESGLKVYFIPKKGYTKKYAIFSTNYGSTDNEFISIDDNQKKQVPEGIAHFLEHKLFEEPEANIFEKFSTLGANVNAYTSFAQTSYLFYSTDFFYENLELLINFVQNPYLTDENVEKEKGIIAQEIRMYEDNPSWRVMFNLLDAMYVNHPVKIDIAGTLESINTIDKETLYKCYNTFYNPSNMVLFVVGDLDFEKIVDVVDSSERKDLARNVKIKRIFPEEPKKLNKKEVVQNMMTANTLFHMGFKDLDVGYIGEAKVKKDIVTNIILDMLFSDSSKFYNEFYETGLIDGSFNSYYTGKKTYGHSLIFGQSPDPKKLYGEIVNLIQKPVEEILDEETFTRIKRDNLGSFLMGLNSIEFIANSFTDLYFEDFLLIDHLDLMDKIKYEDILIRFKEHFKEENLALSIINPLEQ